MPRPSTMPPAATSGTSTFSRTACRSAKVCTSSGLRMPALSAPSTISPSTPKAVDGIDGLDGPAQRRRRVIDGNAGILEPPGVTRRIAGRGRGEVDALAEQPFDDRVLLRRLHLQVTDRQVDAEGLVGVGADRREL